MTTRKNFQKVGLSFEAKTTKVFFFGKILTMNTKLDMVFNFELRNGTRGIALPYFFLGLILLLLFNCLKAERSPFDLSSKSSVSAPLALVARTSDSTPTSSGSTATNSGSAPTNSGSTATNSSSTPTNSVNLRIDYSQTTYIAYIGDTLSISAPTVTGGSFSSFSISPSVSNGLSFDSSTGTISGVLTGSSLNQDYSVTVNGSNTSSSTTITLKIGSASASAVFGQSNYSTNGGGLNASKMSGLYDLSLDSSANLFIADTSNNRGLYVVSGDSSATRVYGQLGSYVTAVTGISADNLNSPRGILVDSSGNLYISDYSNNRVLFYTSGSTTATRVYGQLGSYITGTMNNGGVTADSLAGPYRLALDSSGNLYVPSVFAHRVLVYPAGSTTASLVFGQGGVFTTNTVNKGGISADSLSSPTGVVIDSSGNVYIADRQNNRVLFYLAGSTTATRVYGQQGSFVTNTVNNGGVTADSLSSPTGLALDSNGNLYVADNGNNRVLFFVAGSTTATRVYGQSGSFTSNTANNGGVSADSMNTPFAVTLDNANKLYVADSGNNRILVFYIP